MNEPEFNPEENIAAALEREHIRPADKFDGKELWPLTKGSDLILSQVFSDEDLLLYRALAFVYVHQKRGGKTAEEDMRFHVIPLAWDINSFRLAAMSLRTSFGDRAAELDAEAVKIYKDVLAREEKSRVKPISTGPSKSPVQKKTETSPIAQPGTPSPLPKSSTRRRSK